MTSWRMPPGFIPGTPSCQPLISPLSGEVSGVALDPRGDRLGRLLSNTVPFISQPVYWTVIVSLAPTGVPVPTVTSRPFSPEAEVVKSGAFTSGMVLDIPASDESTGGGDGGGGTGGTNAESGAPKSCPIFR